MKKYALIFVLIFPGMSAMFAAEQSSSPVKVGTKNFTENIILGEIITLLMQQEGIPVMHRKQLGGTRVLWSSLLNGNVDIYPEYTGTITHEILVERGLVGEDEALFELGIRASKPLGFNNTYALGMKSEVAQQLGITKISDLRNHPKLKFGFTNEFMNRPDGWPGLRSYYNLSQHDVNGLEHDIAYRGIESGTIHVTDLYSTDAEIEHYGLLVLEDDLHYFPDYHAVFLYRADLADRWPDAVRVLSRLEGRISGPEMIKMNAQAKILKVPEVKVAADFFVRELGTRPVVYVETMPKRLFLRTLEHLYLVAISLSGAIVLSIPIGVFAAKQPKIGQIILSIVGIIQTIPSLALLVFMIPLLGIGSPPAILALFLYGLLPIVRNTYTGLRNIPSEICESAQALGLPSLPRLWLVELPLASRSILAGIKTSAVINVGTATLGALIGAGGYGQPILTGIRLDDMGLILQGAVPAAVLALLVQLLFDVSERYFVPEGLRMSPNRQYRKT